MCSKDYIKEIILPAVAEGAKRGNREVSDCELLWGGFIATGETEEELAKAKRDIAARISFMHRQELTDKLSISMVGVM